MRTPSCTLLFSAVLAAAVPSAAAAQAARPLHVGISGGPTYVTGRKRDFYDPGYDAQLSVLIPIRAAGFTLRAEATYAGVVGHGRAMQTDPTVDSLHVGDFSMRGGALSGVFEGGTPNGVRPFLSIGAGAYRVRSEGTVNGEDASRRFGSYGIVYGVGASIPVSRVRVVAEARMYNLFSDGSSLRIYPLSIGLIF